VRGSYNPHFDLCGARRDDGAIHKLNVKDVPVDGIWSISLYNAEGHFQKNAFDSYSLNNITAKREGVGAVAVQFGGCDGKVANCLPIHAGLELHGKDLPAARRNSERHMAVPGSAAGELTFHGSSQAAGHHKTDAHRNARPDGRRRYLPVRHRVLTLMSGYDVPSQAIGAA